MSDDADTPEHAAYKEPMSPLVLRSTLGGMLLILQHLLHSQRYLADRMGRPNISQADYEAFNEYTSSYESAIARLDEIADDVFARKDG